MSGGSRKAPCKSKRRSCKRRNEFGDFWRLSAAVNLLRQRGTSEINRRGRCRHRVDNRHRVDSRHEVSPCHHAARTILQ